MLLSGENLDSATVGSGLKTMGIRAFGSDPENKNLRCHKRCSPGPNACHKSYGHGIDCNIESLNALSASTKIIQQIIK